MAAINDHNGAAQLLVNNFGTQEEQAIVKEITARTGQNGISPNDYRLRYETVNKYFAKLKNK